MLRYFAMLILFCGLGCHSSAVKQSAVGDDDKLVRIVEQYAYERKHLDAFEAPYFNIEENLSKFGDFASPGFREKSKKIITDSLGQLSQINANGLTESRGLLYRLFKEDLEVSAKNFDFSEELNFNQMNNRLHAYLDDSSPELTQFPFDSVKHYEDFVKRAEGFTQYVNWQIDRLREGAEHGIAHSCVVATQLPITYRDALETKVEKNPFWRPIKVMPKTFSTADQQRIKKQFKEFIENSILPGYQKFDRYYQQEYMSKCREGFGIYKLPNYKAWYAQAIRANTNLSLDAAQIHEIGLKEVERIAKEIELIKTQIGFKGSYREFLQSLLTNKKYFFGSAKTMFNSFEKVKSETQKKIDQLFVLKPKGDFKIVESSNPEDAAGSYTEPTELLPYGRFVVNTKNLRSVPTYELTTLMLHETVPGHHFQLALQFELKSQLSEYQRKMFSSNAFVEGWALYSEYLGNEMNMFKEPMQRLGHLNDEMLRAVRLVVDTGIHSKGWGQSQSIEYMSRYLANDIKDITNEVNRYSVWPGQALGYKLGEFKILELRHLAEKELGTKFDIKEFHKVVIGHGTLSLSELDYQVKTWIQRQKI